jgi:hypothetical protein
LAVFERAEEGTESLKSEGRGVRSKVRGVRRESPKIEPDD